MEDYKRDFIEFMVRAGALRFGEFTTKSGRRTPFFINTGRYDSGALIGRLGTFYAAAIMQHFGEDFDLLYGPAYKGIPLVTTTAAALALGHGRDVPFAFNRKEAKDHGEGGTLIGRTPSGGARVVLVDDVVTAGTSVRESAALLKGLGEGAASLTGLVVSVDRQERGANGERSALDEVEAEFGLKARAIVTLEEIVACLHNREVDGRVVLDDAMLEKIEKYREEYGAAKKTG